MICKAGDVNMTAMDISKGVVFVSRFQIDNVDVVLVATDSSVAVVALDVHAREIVIQLPVIVLQSDLSFIELVNI